jgi:photosystem II stability/assembly factor-like uncharacterized protein
VYPAALRIVGALAFGACVCFNPFIPSHCIAFLRIRNYLSRMHPLKSLLFPAVLLCAAPVAAQQWVEKMMDPQASFFQVQQAFQQEWQGKSYQRGNGWKQYKRWEWFTEPRSYPTGQRISPAAAYTAYSDFMRNAGVANRSANWAPMGPGSWLSTSYNPGLGRINVIAQDPNNTSVLYAGAPSGGVWKSSDNGASWTPLGDELSAMGVSGIVVDHQNSNTVYIATGDADGADTYSIGVLKSTDGGASWTTTALGHTISQGVVCRRLLMHPTDNQTLLVATNNGIYKTTDGGATWTQSTTGSFRDMEYKPGDPTTVYASTDQLYKSTDGGDTFTATGTGLPAANDVNRMSIAVSADAPSVLYALVGDESDASFLGLYRSSDNGATFTLRSNSPNLFSYEDDGSGTGGQSWYDMALAVNPTNYSEVLVGGINVWRSNNGGTSFTIVSHWVYPSTVGYTHADIHTLDFFGTTLFCGSDGGLFRSTNSGNTWQDITAGMEIMQLYRMGGSVQNANLTATGAQDNGSFIRNGTTWTHVLGADGMEAAYDPGNSSIVYVTSQNGGLQRSANGGVSFNYIAGGIGEDGGWITPYEILSGGAIVAGFENVWKSTNGGTTWTQLSAFTSGQTIRDLDVSNSDPNTMVVVFYGQIHRTSNNGTTWTDIAANLPNNAVTDVHIHPTNPQIMWVTMSGFSAGEKVFVTSDGGSSWTNISSNLPNLPANCIVYQNGTSGGLYVGMDVGVYYTDSTLSNWQPFDQGMPNVIVNELEIHYGAGKLRAATYGRGLWQSDLFTPSLLPPVAQFSYPETMLCAGDSIAFIDASLNAAPGWTWYFPGGSPATSTSPHPSVQYPTAGNYTASLVVANANGSDSIALPVTVSFGQHTLDIEVKTDNYPTETTWSITDQSGAVVAEGGGYSTPLSIYNNLACLNDGCYTFTIYDSYGDGICCGFGNGYYTFTNLTGGNVLANGGNFGTSEATDFCLGTQDIPSAAEHAILAFPNPANQTLVVQSPAQAGFTLYSVSGTVVLTGLLNPGDNSLNVSGLATGKYLLVVNDAHSLTRAPVIILHN